MSEDLDAIVGEAEVLPGTWNGCAFVVLKVYPAGDRDPIAFPFRVDEIPALVEQMQLTAHMAVEKLEEEDGR